MNLQIDKQDNTTISITCKHFKSFDKTPLVLNNRFMLKDRFKKARLDANLTQVQLATLAYSSQAAINKIETGLTLRPRNLEAFATEMSVSPEWLLFGSIDVNTSPGPITKRMIPVISWVQAGEFCESNVLELHDVEEWLPCPASASDKTFGLRVKGDSMTSPHRGERSYPEGIVIYVDPEVDVTSGRRVIAKSTTSDEATFKSYVEDDGLKFLKPINPQFPMKEMTADVHICGVVIGSYWPE